MSITAPQSSLYKVLNLQVGEGKAVFLLVAYSLLMGAALGVFYTCTTSLFLTNFASKQLPLAFVVGGVIVYLLGQAVRLLRPRLGPTSISTSLIIFLVISVGGLLLAGNVLTSKWPYFMLLLWQRVFVFVYGITFWGTAGRLFNFGQAKRLFSFIGTGEVVASILSFLSVPLLLRFLSLDQLLLLSLVFLVLCVGLLAYINREFQALLTSRGPADSPIGPTAAAIVPATTARKSYFKLLNVLALLPVFGLLYVDFMFSVLSKQLFPTKEILAGFLGFFFGICSIIELLIKLFLYQRLMNTYSIRFSVVVLPLALLISYGLGAIYGSVYGVTSMFFAFVALSRFFMNPLRRAVSEPAYQLLFQPIPSAERTLLHSRIEGGPKALGTLLSGLLLLALYALGLESMVVLSYVFVIVLVFWTITSFRIQGEYGDMLREAIARSAAYVHRQVLAVGKAEATPEWAPAIFNPPSLETLSQLAASKAADDRVRAATLLGHSGRYYAYQPLLALLQDPEPLVCAAAIQAAGRLRKSELWPGLVVHLAAAPHRAAATQALLAAGEPVVPALVKMLRADLPVPRQADLVALVSQVGGATARRFLRAHLNHSVPVVREQVIAGLARQHHRATGTEQAGLLLLLDEQVEQLVWLAAAELDVAAYPPESTLRQALHQESLRLMPKLFDVLSLLYGNNQFDVISELIAQKNEEVQGFLLELLGTLLPREVKDKITPLFADTLLAERVRKMAAEYPQPQLLVEARLHDIINKDYSRLRPYTKAVAVHELLHWHRTDPTTLLVANANSPEPVLAEASLYVLHHLNPSRFAEIHRLLRGQPGGAALADRVAAGLLAKELLVMQEALTLAEAVELLPA